MKTLIIDIETTPNLVYTWGTRMQDISLNQIVTPSRLLCFAAKFMGEPKIYFRSDWNQSFNDMVFGAWKLLDEADVVVGYNSDQFDLKRLNGEFLRLKLNPPAPYQTVDIYKVIKRNFQFVSHKLENVLREMNLDEKIKHRGFTLWPACMNGDKSAQREMRRYCIGDVLPLEDAYRELLPWISGHPHVGLFTGTDGCPNCGGTSLQSRGYSYTTLGKYQRFQCQTCGKWSRGGKREEGADLRG